MTSTTLIIGSIAAFLSLFCWVSFLSGLFRMFRTIRLGRSAPNRWRPFFPRFRHMLIEFIAHTRMVKFRTVGWAHWLVMTGFLLGSIFWFEAYGQTFDPDFHWPIFGAWHIYLLLDELMGIGTVVGIVVLMTIRQLNHPRVPERLSRFAGSDFKAAYFVEWVVLLEGLGMVFVKTFKIASGVEHPPLWTSFFTEEFAKLFTGIPTYAVSLAAVIKLMSGMVWLYFVGRNINWGVAWHRFAAFFNIYFKRNADGTVALGAAQPIMDNGKMVNLEDADPDEIAFGAGAIEDFSWKDILDFTTCTECGRCQSQCPAWNTGKPLSPKLLIMSLRDHTYAKAPYLLAGGKKDMAGEEIGLVDKEGKPLEDKINAISEAARLEAGRPLVGPADPDGLGGIIDPETLWSCTTCGACVEQCPVDIEHVDHIIDMRRYQVLIESEFPSELSGLFKNLENKGNPWGQNSSARNNWIKEMDFQIPIYGKDTDNFSGFEYLFWVGCAGAYEDRAKKTTKAVAELLNIAQVPFLVLGDGETCTGDSARRAGNELLFQTLAQQNIATFDELFDEIDGDKRKIVVTCAHCFNTLSNEYPQLGAKYQVVHHTQLLNRLVRDKKLVPVAEPNTTITYHDPCYLGRHNKIYEAPRELVEATGANIKEMPRHGERSMCCGAGGARMWMEEQLGKRINIDRVDEALSTSPQKIATGCPFCRVMLSDGVTARATEDQPAPEVVDVSMMLLDAVKRGNPTIPTDFLTKIAEKSSQTVKESEPETAEIVKDDADTKPIETAKPAAEPAKPPAEASKPAVGLGMAAGMKRPGSQGSAPAAKSAPATDAKPADHADTKPIETAKPEEAAKPAESKPAVGLGMAAGMKRPGSAGAAPVAKPAEDKTTESKPDESKEPVDQEAEVAEAKPVEKIEAKTESKPETAEPVASKPVVGLGMASGLKRPGSAGAAPVAKPAEDKTTETEPVEEAESKTVAEEKSSETSKPEAEEKSVTEAPEAEETTSTETKPVDEAKAQSSKTESTEEPKALNLKATEEDVNTDKTVGLKIAKGIRRPGSN